MLTQKAPAKPKPAPAAGAAPALDDLICYFEGRFIPMRDAKVSIMTHAFMYGTAVFEGIRAYWNEEQGTLHGLFIREHMERIRRNAGMLLMEGLPTVDELAALPRYLRYLCHGWEIAQLALSDSCSQGTEYCL